jgi:hypothetical protein
VLDEKLAVAGHDQVRLDDLRCAGTECRCGRCLDVRRECQLIFLEYYNLMPGSSQQQ